MVHFRVVPETCLQHTLAGGVGKVYLGRESISGNAYTYVLQALRENYRNKEPRGIWVTSLVNDFGSGSE